jgi:hypothetical protein
MACMNGRLVWYDRTGWQTMVTASRLPSCIQAMENEYLDFRMAGIAPRGLWLLAARTQGPAVVFSAAPRVQTLCAVVQLILAKSSARPHPPPRTSVSQPAPLVAPRPDLPCNLSFCPPSRI